MPFVHKGPDACGARHDTVAEAKACESDAQAADWEASLDLCPVCDGAHSWRGVGCHWENRGYDEARADEDREAAMGILPWHEARDLAEGRVTA